VILDTESVFRHITDGELVLIHSAIESGWRARSHRPEDAAGALAVTKLVEAAVLAEFRRREITYMKVATRLMQIVVERMPTRRGES